MPQHASAKKRLRQNEKRRLRNKILKSRLKTVSKKVISAPSKEEGEKGLKEAYKLYDKASSKNVLHKNTAARKKAKLAKAVQSKAETKKKKKTKSKKEE